MIDTEYDVIVVGGGIAGVACALSSSRNGAKTLLVESTYMLGGLATAGLITIYLPLCDGEGTQLCYGIAEELLRLSISLGAEKECPTAWIEQGTKEERSKARFCTQYNPHVFAVLIEQLLIKESVDILYGTILSDVKMNAEGDRIEKIFLNSRTEKCCYSAKAFVDCTGDATLCDYAGESTALSESGNVLASWYYEVLEGENNLRICGNSDYIYSKNMARDTFGGLDTVELSRVVTKSHQNILYDYLKKGNSSLKHSLASIASIPQVRMTRRLCGVEEIEKKDNKKYFENSVGLFGSWLEKGLVYELPMGTLYGKKVGNLTVAGRCISTKGDDMWDITRVIPVCAVTGEAAGVISSCYAAMGEMNILEVQKILQARGVKLHLKDILG